MCILGRIVCAVNGAANVSTIELVRHEVHGRMMNTKREALRDDLERLIHEHASLVELALEVLDDAEVEQAAKVPLAAAAHYGAEKIDLIPDDFPAYGLVDDLFVLAIGLHDTLNRDAGAGERYREHLVGGRTLAELFDAMRARFYGFWEFCRQQTRAFFEQFQAAYDENDGAVRAARDELAGELNAIRESTATTKLRPEDVDAFLAHFRAFNPDDLA